MDDFEQGRNVTPLPPGLRSLTWSTKVQELLPDDAEWQLADAYASKHANVHDILIHLSGLAS